ncbi:MAG TPA: rhamnulokinase family protein [Aggregatilineales bacterium]|nr:rhamnulokinase family protein [Aggregatilineales bacterium]
MTTTLAIDLGNESGRVMRLRYDGSRISAEEVYRFANGPVTLRGTLHWDVLRLWNEIESGLSAALGEPAEGIGVDSFGVDFGLLDDRGQLLGNPVHMRDSRTEGMMDWVLERVPKEYLFERTGIGFYVINTLYQLAALFHQSPWQLDSARTFLTMPNLINYWLTGEKVSEWTHSTTTQMVNWRDEDWDTDTLDQLMIPTMMLPEIVPPGHRIGRYQGVPVYTVASHDTASAVVAVPAETAHYAYISSGTWSLFGIETRQPLTNTLALAANLTSEGGAYGTFRPSQLVMGMWLLQQCRLVWAAAGISTSYARLIAEAKKAPAFGPLINPDDARFFSPGDMPARIRAFCEETGQVPPQTPGEFVRCILESLALKYRRVLEQLIAASTQPVEVIHIVGGGAQNALLCQMTADATNRPVVAGPVEATALGNGLVQLIARGDLKDVVDARRLVRQSFALKTYKPKGHARWDEVYQDRFLTLLS